jgi:hypothetical protein
MAKVDDSADLEAVDLGEAAQAGLAEEGDAGQQVLAGMHFKTHMKFFGMGLRTNDEGFKLGDEGSVLVRYRVVSVGDELMKDDMERHVVGVQVQSVQATAPGDAAGG